MMELNDPKWLRFRDELVSLAATGDHEWLDLEEIRSVLGDAYRKGLDPSLVISCRAATSSNQEFATQLRDLVRETKIRILAIDDEMPFVNLLRLNLEKTGRYIVRTESNSLRWREAVAGFRPHLLILDMVMPGIDGREILHALRTEEATRSLPIIVLTAILQESSTGAVNRDGILFLSKPVALKALLHCIEEHLAAAGIG